MSKVNKWSEINIKVGLSGTNVPEEIIWDATDAQGQNAQPCKAMLLSLFDKDHLDTIKLDLWTTEMQVIEMDRFMYQTLKALSDTYYKATNNSELAGAMQQFAQYFGEKTEILIPPSES